MISPIEIKIKLKKSKNNIPSSSKNLNHLNNSPSDSNRIFLKFFIFSLKKLCRGKIDIYTLNQITYLPLIVCQKLIISFLNKNSSVNLENADLLKLDSNTFIDNFYIIYFGSNYEKIKIISKFLSFDGKFIYYDDVKLLLLHLHMRLFYDKTENKILSILNNFFNGLDKMNIEEFSQKSLEKNFDIIYVFLGFFEKLKFFNDEQIKFFDSYYSSSSENKKKEKNIRFMKDNTLSILNSSIITNNTSYLNNSFDEIKGGNSNNFQRLFSEINNQFSLKKNFLFDIENNLIISAKAKKYVKEIKIVDIFSENFDEEDNEMRQCLKAFEEDVIELKSNCFNLNDNNIDNNNYLTDGPYVTNKNNFIKEEFSEEENYDISNKIKKRKTYKNGLLDFMPKKKNSLIFGLDLKKNYTIQHSFLHNDLNNSYYETNSNFSILKTLSISNNNLNSSFCSANNNFFLNNLFYSNNNNNYFIINCYKLSVTSTKLKEVKLIFFDNIIFYLDNKNSSLTNNNINNSYFKMKYFIIISQLYPKIIKNPIISKNLLNDLQEFEQKNSNIFQLQLVSTIHSEKIVNNFFLTNYEDALKCKNHIEKIQNLKKLTDYYNTNFEDCKELGSGHFGKVYLVHHLISNVKVSLKLLKKFNNKNDIEELNDIEKDHKIEDFKCTQWEKDIFIFLSHITQCKNIIKCYEYIETEKEIYFINEYCNLGNIKYIHDIEKTNSLINKLSIQLIKGIHCLHKYGIIHRDIKNTNSLITMDETKKITLKIIDFGLSKVIGFREQVKDCYGSLPFKSPELILGNYYNFSVDIWALGITIYWLVYGKYPCNGGSRHKTKNLICKYEFKSEEIREDSKNELFNEIMLKCLVNDCKKRVNIYDLKKFIGERKNKNKNNKNF